MTYFFRCLLVLLISAFSLAQAEQRVALVIGNSAYPTGALENPKNDAAAIAASFKRLGFEVDLKLNASKADLDNALKKLSSKADKADVAVIFYAGHGMQVNNYNYIIPVDAKPQNERDLKREMIKLDDAIDDMGNAKVKLVFFDACRDNPMARSFTRGASRGLAAPSEATGTLISFATKHGNTAYDGDGKHSPYTEVLLSALENPTDEIHALLRKKIQQGVKQKTRGQQEPWTYGNLDGDFYFIQGPVNITVNLPAKPPAASAAVRLQSAAEIEQELWNSIKDANNPGALNEYFKAYPEGRFIALAKVLLAKFKSDAPPAVPVPVIAAQPALAPAPAPKTEQKKLDAHDTPRDFGMLRDVIFRRTNDSGAVVAVTFPNRQINPDISRQGGSLVVEFLRAKSPDFLRRKLDLTDFETPVKSISTKQIGDRVQIIIESRGEWEHKAYQREEEFLIEIRDLSVIASRK